MQRISLVHLSTCPQIGILGAISRLVALTLALLYENWVFWIDRESRVVSEEYGGWLLDKESSDCRLLCLSFLALIDLKSSLYSANF
jgi:hypothetical protein